MARSRNIKPKFFTNDLLAELPYEGRLLFIGLWTIADREGRLLDRPKKIKMELFPADSMDVEPLLQGLADRGFIRRYSVDDHSFIQVVNWQKHQNPHFREQPSVIPAPEERRSERKASDKPEASPRLSDDEKGKSLRLVSGLPEAGIGQEPGEPEESPVQAVLIPDSGFLIPDSGYLIPDTGFRIPDPLQQQPIATADAAAAPKRRKASPKVEAKEEPNPLNLDTWHAYKTAYIERYAAVPVRDAKVNTQIRNFVKSLGSEAPAVAAFYVQHNAQRYVACMHQVGTMVIDYAKLRTEWYTNKTMTAEKARAADRTATNLDAFGPLLAAARAREAQEG